MTIHDLGVIESLENFGDSENGVRRSLPNTDRRSQENEAKNKAFARKPDFLTSLGTSDKVPRNFERVSARTLIMRKSPWILCLFLLMGGLLGGILGEILRVIAPQGTIQNIFSTALMPGIQPPVTFDLVLFKLTVGIMIKLNLLTFLGAFLGIYLYKHI